MRSGKIDGPSANSLSSPLVKLEGWIGLPRADSEFGLRVNDIWVNDIKKTVRAGLETTEGGPFLSGWSKWLDLTQFIRPGERGVIARLYSDGVCVCEMPYRLARRAGSEAGDPLYYFMHMPKTGGTTVREMSIERIAPEKRLYLYENDPFYLSSAEFESLSDEAIANTELVYGHFDWGVHRNKTRPARYFTILRDPYEHFLSMYFYHKQIVGTEDIRNTKSVFDVIENSVNPAFDNFFCRSLCGGLPHTREVNEQDFETAREIIDRDFAFVGLTEYLQDSLSVITRLTGLPINEGRDRLNVTGLTTERLYLDILRYREAVWPRIRYDIALYEYAKAKFWDRRAPVAQSTESSEAVVVSINEAETTARKKTSQN